MVVLPSKRDSSEAACCFRLASSFLMSLLLSETEPLFKTSCRSSEAIDATCPSEPLSTCSLSKFIWSMIFWLSRLEFVVVDDVELNVSSCSMLSLMLFSSRLTVSASWLEYSVTSAAPLDTLSPSE